MTVNNEELQKQIPQASSYSDRDGVWCQGPWVTYAWVRKSESWRFNGIDKSEDLPQRPRSKVGIQLEGRDKDERKTMTESSPGKLVPI